MTKVFYATPYSRFIEIKSSFGRRKSEVSVRKLMVGDKFSMVGNN